MKKKASLICLVVFVLIGVIFIAQPLGQDASLSSESAIDTTPPKAEFEFSFQNADPSKPDFIVKLLSRNGGYIIQNNETTLLAEATDTVNHICMDAPDRSMHLYINDSDMLLLVEENGEWMTYQTNIEQENPLPNPMIEKLNGLTQFKFSAEDETAMIATETVTIPKQEQIPYTQYDIQLTWQEQDYAFGYCVYEDGATLMSADAPVEMHPLITKDTKWVLDLEHTQMVNTLSNEKVPFTITSKSEGKALSPNGSQETEDIHYSYTIQMNEAHYLEKIIVQSEDHTPIQYETLYNDVIDIPEIPNDAQTLPEETAWQFIQMLLSVWSL